jgi:fatty-acyl-CoA synthase
MNIYTQLKQQAARFPGKILISVDNEAVTYAAFVQEVERIANALNMLGVTPGQKVALVLPNAVLWYEIFWAIVKLGALPVPMDPQSGEWELVRLLSLTEVEICFAAPLYRQNRILENLLAGRPHIPGLKTIIVTGLENAPADVLKFTDFLRLAPVRTTAMATYDAAADAALMLACTSGSTGNPKVIVVPHAGFYRSQLDMAS